MTRHTLAATRSLRRARLLRRSAPRSSHTRTRRCALRPRDCRIGICRPTRFSAARASASSTMSRSRSFTCRWPPATPMSLVFFRGSDVVVTGGVIEDLTYPVIRSADGGTVNGTLAALNRVLDLTVAEWRAQGGTMVIRTAAESTTRAMSPSIATWSRSFAIEYRMRSARDLRSSKLKRHASRATTTAGTRRPPVPLPPTSSSRRFIEA